MYLNIMFVWINMLLLGVVGFIKILVGVCVIGLEFIDFVMDFIMVGKIKMCFVGGYDDFGEEELFGFVKMKVIVDVVVELVWGCLFLEMLWLIVESWVGFVEFYGCGV